MADQTNRAGSRKPQIFASVLKDQTDSLFSRSKSTVKGSHHLKKRNLEKNFLKMVTPPPRLVFVKSLFRFFSPIFKGKFFLGISVLFKGLLLCETMGTFGTFRYLSYLGHFWTIWAILDHFGPFLNKSRKMHSPPPFEKVFLKILHFLK